MEGGKGLKKKIVGRGQKNYFHQKNTIFFSKTYKFFKFKIQFLFWCSYVSLKQNLIGEGIS